MYLSPAQWNLKLAAGIGWQEAYRAVESVTRDWLNERGIPIEAAVTTTYLVEHLYPEQFARGDGILARKRIFNALAALATRGLADCASRGPERKLKRLGKTVKPWLWHAPAVPNPEAKHIECPNCQHRFTP